MSSSTTFTGAGFSIESVEWHAPATIRVHFTQDPLAVNASNANDATNQTNWSISGPEINVVVAAGAVYNDPMAVDLFLLAPLVAGTWTITGSNSIQSVDLDNLDNPRVVQLVASVVQPQEPVSMGAENDTDEDILRKHLNPALKGPGWNAVIAAMATGDRKNRENARLAFDQLYKATASGEYLTRRAADDGVARPRHIGMPDDLFRRYAISTTNSKLVESALLKILQAFYGDDAVRAHVDSDAGPFVLQDKDDITFLIDDTLSVTVTFTEDDFALIGQAQPVEVAAAITRAFRFAGSNAYAVAAKDAEGKDTVVRVYSGSMGLSSSIRVTGGKAQSALMFPDWLSNVQATPLPTSWKVTYNTKTGFWVYSTVNEAGLDISFLREGDYVNVYGSEFLAGNRGSFEVKKVHNTFNGSNFIQSFEVLNPNGVDQSTPFAQTTSRSVLYFRPTRHTIYSTNHRAVIVSSLPNEVDLVLPATSIAVGRGPRKAAYGQANNSIPISSLERIRGEVRVTTTTQHGLAVGNQVLIEGVYGSTTPPPTTPGSGTTSSYTSSTSKGSIWSTSAGTAHLCGGVGGVAVRLLDGRVFHAGGYRLNAGTIVDDIYYWNILEVTSDNVLASGVRQVVFAEREAGAPYNVLPHPINFQGASVGINPSWYYNNVLMTGGESMFAGGREVWNTNFLFRPAPAPDYGFVSSLTSSMAMNSPRAAHIQVTLNNPSQAWHGGFFVAGGITIRNRATNTTERYSPVEGITGPWANRASMSEPRAQAQAVTLSDGRIMVIGGRPLSHGHNLTPDTVALWHFDDLGGTLTDGSSNGLNLTNYSTVLIYGESGYARRYPTGSWSDRPSSDAVLHDLFLNNVDSKGYTVQFWYNNNAGASNGALLMYGSKAADLNGLASTNCLFGVGITPGGEYALYWHDGNNSAHINTTSGGAVATYGTYEWNHVSVVVSPTGTAGLVNQALYINGHLVQTWLNQTIPTGGANAIFYVASGPGIGGVASNFVNGAIDDVRLCNTPHDASTVWQDYQYATGELYYPNYERVGRVSATCEIYDPVTNTWTPTGSMAMARFNHRAVLLNDGRVLVVGGIGVNPTLGGAVPAPLVECEFWDPVVGAWHPAGRLKYAREHVVAEYLPNRNQVIVTGGSDANGKTTTEIFDVASMKWVSSSANLPNPQTGAVSAILKDDLIAIIGGYNPGTNTSGSFLSLYIPNHDRFFASGLNGVHRVTSVPSSTSFRYETDEQDYTLNASNYATATPVGARASNIPGAFIFSPDEGVSVTGTQTTTTQALDEGQRYAKVAVADATKFPDEPGWIAFSFGHENQVAPVRYLGRLSSTSIAIDAGFKFPKSVESGASVILLASKGPYVPKQPEEAGAFYLTASSAGRVAAQAAVQEAVGAGIEVNVDIVYPGDRGLGNEGAPSKGVNKVSDKVTVWASNDVDAEVERAREDK